MRSCSRRVAAQMHVESATVEGGSPVCCGKPANMSKIKNVEFCWKSGEPSSKSNYTLDNR